MKDRSKGKPHLEVWMMLTKRNHCSDVSATTSLSFAKRLVVTCFVAGKGYGLAKDPYALNHSFPPLVVEIM